MKTFLFRNTSAAVQRHHDSRGSVEGGINYTQMISHYPRTQRLVQSIHMNQSAVLTAWGYK